MLKRYGLPTFYLFIVFLCGLAVGVSGYHFYQLRTVSANVPGPRNPDEWKKRHMAELRQVLHLTDDQAGKISGILDQTRQESHDVLETIRPKMEGIQADQYARVKAVLTPDQVTEYEKLHAERERQRKERPRF